jgi:hypothetical protein
VETVRSSKRRVELVLHGTKSIKTSLTDTAVKALQKTSGVETLNVLSSSPILVTLMKGALGSSETSVLTRATRRNIPEYTIHSISGPSVDEDMYNLFVAVDSVSTATFVTCFPQSCSYQYMFYLCVCGPSLLCFGAVVCLSIPCYRFGNDSNKSIFDSGGN